MTPTEYVSRRVKLRPDLLKLERLISEHLTDLQKRDGPEATIDSAVLVSNQLSFDLTIDNVPGLHRFPAKDCQLIESP